MSKKLFIKGVSYSYLKQIVLMLTGIISVPLTLNYFGVSIFGILTLIMGLIGYLNNIAFGIPTAMTSLVAKTSNVNDKYIILKKSVRLLTIIISIVLTVFLVVLYYQDDWIVTMLGNVDPRYIDITKYIFILFVIVTLIKIPVTLYAQFFVGMNLVYLSEIYQILIMILSFFAIIITIYLKLDIYAYVILLLGAQLIINLSSMFHVLLKYSYTKENIDDEKRISYNKILISGFSFFQFGLAASIIWNTDNLVISHFLSPELVAPYSIAFKMFLYLFSFSAILNGIAGPIYGNAFAQNDWIKINHILSTILKILPVLGAGVWVFLIFFSKELVQIWTHNEMAFGGYLLFFSLGMYGYVISFVNTYVTLVFSLNQARHTLKIAWMEALLNLLLSIIFIKFLGIGGVGLATVLASILTTFIFLPKVIKRITEDKIQLEYKYAKKYFIFLVFPSVSIAIFSIVIDFLIVKIVLFIFLAIINVFWAWKLMDETDKEFLLKIIKKKG